MIRPFLYMGSPTHSPIENTYMAIKTSKTEGRFQTKVDDAHEVDMQLGKMEDDIRKLKIDFDIYFNGSSKRPPLEARARLDAFIKRLSDNRNLTFAQRYLFNTLVARFVSYRELWRRQLKAKGEDLL